MRQEDKFLSFLQQHKGILYKIANGYCKNEEDRKDLVQEITYQLWLSFDKYNPEFQYSTWMYRIALNVAISFYRKGNQSILKTEIIEEVHISISEISGNDEQEENLNQLHQFIQELKEMDKAIMLLYLDQKTHREIAEIMGISESNVGTKVNRIKGLLTQKFKTKN